MHCAIWPCLAQIFGGIFGYKRGLTIVRVTITCSIIWHTPGTLSLVGYVVGGQELGYLAFAVTKYRAMMVTNTIPRGTFSRTLGRWHSNARV